MSRSYQKYPASWMGKNRPRRKLNKRIAARLVRDYKGDIPDGKWYKKLACRDEVEGEYARVEFVGDFHRWLNNRFNEHLERAALRYCWDFPHKHILHWDLEKEFDDITMDEWRAQFKWACAK